MFLSLLVFFLILSILIFVHELGHFLAAKKAGIIIEEFGFGLPPRIWGVKRKGTIYSLNLLPFGGFVKLYGEDREEEERGEKKWKNAFSAKPKKVQAMVLIAGVTMNFLLAWLLISYIFTQGVFVPSDKVHVEKVIKDSPASKAGIKEGDVIKRINDFEIKKTEDLIKITQKYSGEEIKITIERENQPSFLLNLTPRRDFPANQGPMGIIISSLEEKKYSLFQAPILGMKEALGMSYMIVGAFAGIVFKLLTLAEISKEVAGPVGIFQVTQEAVKFGHLAVLQMLGLLSLNLAVVNILPIPALDGGRLLFLLIEALTGRKIRPAWEKRAHEIGMVLLLFLILMITINDIGRIIRMTNLGAGIKSISP